MRAVIGYLFFLVSLSLIHLGDTALPLSRGFKMKAIYTTVNNRKTFLGKHINNTIVREFPFSKAVLWQNKGLGFDKRLLEYAKENKDKIAATKKAYYQKNKDKVAEWRKENREEIIKYVKGWRKLNNEKIKEWVQSEKGKKSCKISSWKHIGVISDDFDVLYEKYITTNNCENCDIELVSGTGLSNKKHLDHSHETNLFRNILCGNCNIKRRE